jgi:hypothetical protein
MPEPLATYIQRGGALTFLNGHVFLWKQPRRLISERSWADARGNRVGPISCGPAYDRSLHCPVGLHCARAAPCSCHWVSTCAFSPRKMWPAQRQPQRRVPPAPNRSAWAAAWRRRRVPRACPSHRLRSPPWTNTMEHTRARE